VSKIIPFLQIVRHRTRGLAWIDPLTRAGIGSVFRGRIGYFALIVVSALIGFLVCATTPGQTTEISRSSPRNEDASDPIAPNDGLLYVHAKLMQIAVSGSGSPVLGFVECRHYPREHMKLAQVGVSTDGHALLRLVTGDQCLFGSNPADTARGGTNSQNSGTTIPVRYLQPYAAAPWFNGRLTPYRQYACEKFGPACPVALAIQLAENAAGACEVYHYNASDGTLDWGFFQINTVHLTRRGLNLRDLLDCKANIDFAYQLFLEEGFEPWTTFRNGAYRKYLAHGDLGTRLPTIAADRSIARQLFRGRIESF
jgi:hypothetical protein